jgi:DNA-binding NtrC family response regulator
MPPLRDRKEDIPKLIDYFFEKFSREESRERPHISDRAVQRLHAHSWPGNVRELQNVCRRAVSMFPGEDLSFDVLDSWLSDSVTVLEARSLRDGRILADAERQLIENTLTRFGGHRERTARALGIGVRTLGMKLKQWRDQAAGAAR